MIMRVLFVSCLLLAEIIYVFSEQNIDASKSEVKDVINLKIDDSSVLSSENTQEAQRKRDPGYYYTKSDRYSHANHRDCARPGYSGRIINRHQNQVIRPFKHYGPPQQSPAHNHEPIKAKPSEPLLNQDIPSFTRDTEFIPENPISSQNNEPFGQHTANYLPPQNQKLPANNPPHLFSNKQYNFIKDPEQNQQFRNPQQSQQLLHINNQNSIGNNFDTSNTNFNHNHHISDAATFLSQNAQAISNLYGAPAAAEVYAPNNQEFNEINQNQQLNQYNLHKENLQNSNVQPNHGLQGALPSYASGFLNTQDSLEKFQSLEKDRIIAHLQQALTDQESAGRHTQNLNKYLENENHQVPNLQPPSISQQSVYSPTTAISSPGYQGFYTPSGLVTSTTLPPISTPTTTASTTHVLTHGSSGSGTTQTGISLPVPGNLRPAVVNPGFPQYSGFVPNLFSTGFIPSSPSYATTLISTSHLRPTDNSPTHFGIPIPSLQGQIPPVHQVPVHQPSATVPATTKPAIIPPSNPNTPTLSIPLGSVSTILQPPIVSVKPKPVSVIPAATPVHPVIGTHPAVLNPNLVYKPVKVLPFYYYPNVAFSSLHKSIASAPIHPWSYAPSFPQTKESQIWK